MAHYGEGTYSMDSVIDRTLGDLLHPARVGNPTAVINAVARELGQDVADWRFERLVQFYAGLEQRHQSDPEG